MKRLAILGASGHGKVVAEIAELVGWDDIRFYDDVLPRNSVNGHWIVEGDSQMMVDSASELDGILVAIGNNEVRAQKLGWLKGLCLPLATVIHPAAVVSKRALVGEGSVVMANVVINCDVSLGLGTILNTGCDIDHDCVLNNFVHISPNATLCGGVRIGDCSWVGAGAVIRQLVSIGASITIGAGSVVTSDLTNPGVYAGIPASFLKAQPTASFHSS